MAYTPPRVDEWHHRARVGLNLPLPSPPSKRTVCAPSTPVVCSSCRFFSIVRTGRVPDIPQMRQRWRIVQCYSMDSKKSGSFDRVKRLDSMTHTQIRIDGARPTRVSSPDVTALQPSRPTAVPKTERKWRSRLTRWTMGGILLAAAGWLVVPSIMFRTSVRATVTAPLVDVRIPLQGVVCGSTTARRHQGKCRGKAV